MKYIFIILVALFVLSCHFSCRPKPKKTDTEKAKREKVDDGDVLRPEEGYGNPEVQRAEKTKDSINEFQNAAARARPQPCLQVTGLQETGKTANTASFSWTSTGVNKYYVYKNIGTAVVYIGTATTTSFTATGLTQNTDNIFRVAGVGKGNKTCPQSEPITITTTSAPQPPGGTGQPNVVLLQFEADTVSGTWWNTSGDIISPGSGLTEDKKLEIFNHFKVIYSEHPKVFFTMDRNVYNNADPNYKQKIIFTTNHSWYGTAGGVSFVGSFNTGQPNFVFTELLNFVSKNCYLAGEHELGHGLGLYHNVDSCSQSYGLMRLCSDGIYRAPVMGGSYTEIPHYFYTPARASQWNILGMQKNVCQPRNEDEIIESHVR